MLAVPLRYGLLTPLLVPINFIHDKKIGHLRRYDTQSLKTKFKDWELVKSCYPGHFNKAMKVVVNNFVNLFDEDDIERIDRKYENIILGASNIVCFFKRPPRWIMTGVSNNG